MCKICAFSPEKPTNRQKFYISGRSRYTYTSTSYIYIIYIYLNKFFVSQETVEVKFGGIELSVRFFSKKASTTAGSVTRRLKPKTCQNWEAKTLAGNEGGF